MRALLRFALPRSFLLGLAAIACLCRPSVAAPATRPNILFIFSDDHAQHAISAYGSQVNHTPHLDRLASAGARFTNAFVTNSICTPSLAPLLRGEAPADWRGSIYYRYYHAPGHHNTHAHYGVRTATHKLIHYWKQDAWELFDLERDPSELHNLLHDLTEATRPDVVKTHAFLKAELARLQAEYGDTGQYADPATWPEGGVDGVGKNRQLLGVKTVAEAIMASGASADTGAMNPTR